MINWRRRRWMEDQRGWNPLVQCLSPLGHFFPLSKTSDHCSPISFIMDLAIPRRKTFEELWRTLSYPRWDTDHIRRWLQLQQKCWIQKGLRLEWLDPWLWNLIKRCCIWWKLGKYAIYVKFENFAKYVEDAKYAKPNIPNQTYQTRPTKPNLPNQAHQTKPK